MANLSGTTIMLTGAGGALASAVAQELVDAGAELILVGRGDSLKRAEDRLPATEVLDLDLTDPACIEVLRKHKVDALVHTVGGFAMQDAHKATPDDLTQMMSLNMTTLFHCVQGVLPHMLRQKEGMIVGISAGQAARMSGKGAALYTASKAAVAAYLLSLNDELSAKGVHSCVVYPMGALDTPANRESGVSWERAIDPRGVAQSIAHALTRPARAHVTELKIYPEV
ncbi:SDR family oxidoreductase [Deinococcus ruber]|uniref:Short-chain dehydrogenase n=1 Tax=Deinococcus ruber TaxID=1848197 RepID=A0A918FA34_9DEIO|nr:SDR family NAD(P)-dependent oxidoreductase [Deinococcus ruber]GGR14992.1 short-chain dehydrogenase [Deinococcus ruber]